MTGLPTFALAQIRQVLASAMVLIGVLLLNSGESAASCGDYVTVGGHSTTMSGHGITLRPVEHDPSNSSDPAPRCHGLFCSGNGQFPVTPPTIPDTNRHDDGCIAVGVRVNQQSVDQSNVAEQPAQTIHLGLSIYRPPRHFSA
jgi:hypothetical protein